MSSDEDQQSKKVSLRETMQRMEREKARILDEAAAYAAKAAAKAAEIDLDMATMRRLAATYNLEVNILEEPNSTGQPSKAGIALTQSSSLTIADLVKQYRTHERSPYRKLKFRTREDYDGQIDRIVKEYGFERLSDLNADSIRRFYENWSIGGKFAMGHALVTKFRAICSFGTTVLNDDACTRLSTILGTLRFKQPKVRTERMTAEQAAAIITKAHEFEWPSIAIAQAFQFDLGMLQRDVVGEWVPIKEAGASEVTHNGQKWLRGLRWSDIKNINGGLFLRRSATVGEFADINLETAPMVMEELTKIGRLPTHGPLLICEASGRPWSTAEFRRKWRIVADAAGVPKTVRNMDTRPKAATGGRLHSSRRQYGGADT